MEEIKEKVFKENIPRWAYILLTIFVYFIIAILVFFAWGVCNVSAAVGQTTYTVPSTNEVFMYDCTSDTNCDGRSLTLNYNNYGYLYTGDITVSANEKIDIYLVVNESLIENNYYTLNHYIAIMQNSSYVTTNYLVGANNKVSLVNRTSNWYNTISNGGTMTTLHMTQGTNNYNVPTYVTQITFKADRNSSYIHSQIMFSTGGTYNIEYRGYSINYNGQYNETLTSSQVQNIIQQQNAAQTQAINQNQDQNTEEQIESQKVCSNMKKNGNDNIGTDNYALGETNNEVYDVSYAISDYIDVEQNKQYKLGNLTGNANSYCLYNQDKTTYHCHSYLRNETIIFTTGNDYYIRYTINKYRNSYIEGEFCDNGNQVMNQSLLDMADKIHETNNQLEATFTPENPNTTDFDDLEDIETDLHTYTDVDLDTMDVEIDTDTSSWVWTTITSLLNTSSQVFGMIISILSIGIIKLILAR